ncbi:IS200/IS605 family transposase [Nonomuraea sp. NPDC051941]|uniref:IS200/IS605 family transposase n=1 Tax=Nonomuraea sp. NPDC051941 TaxID=3364373 RepID=UPI0037C76468
MTRQVRISPGAAYDLGYHVWCPRYCRRVLGGSIKTLEKLIRTKAAERDGEIDALEAMPDHEHLFFKPHPKNSPSYVTDQFKGYTAHVLRAECSHLRSALPMVWSRSSFVASVGAVAWSRPRSCSAPPRPPDDKAPKPGAVSRA